MCFCWRAIKLFLGVGLLYFEQIIRSDGTGQPGVQHERLPDVEEKIEGLQNGTTMQDKFEGEEYFCIKMNILAGIEVKSERQKHALMCVVINGLLGESQDTLALFNCLSEAGTPNTNYCQIFPLCRKIGRITKNC